MKFSKIIIVFLIILIILEGIAYINLMISEKYETDISIIEFSNLTQQQKDFQILRIEKRTLQIHQQKTFLKILMAVTLISFIYVVWNRFKKRKSVNQF